MMNLPANHSLAARQRGAVSIVIAMLMMFILTAAVLGALKMSSSSVIDAAKNEGQVSALYLADSGMERALATLRSAALTNSYTNLTCTDLSGQSVNLGRGSFTYINAVSYDQTGTPGGSCSGGNCTQCVLTVKGIIGTTSRTIQAQLVATQQNGTSGQTNTGCPTANCTPNVAMSMTVPTANSFAFVHILFNPTTNWGGSPVTPSCKDTGTGSLTACTLAWNITGNYYNNPASIGVHASIPSVGTYSITEEVLTTLPSSDSKYNYAAVGAIFHSVGGTASYVGSFAKSPATTGTFPNKHVNCSGVALTDPRTQPLPAIDCSPSDYQHAYLDTGWTCNANSVNTPNWSNAGSSDTLIGGFGGKPYYPGSSSRCGNLNGVNYYHSSTQRCSNELNGLAVNGQPLFQQLSLDGQQGDYMYSQLWWTYNPAYYATTATATNGASFTGAIGATVTGSVGSSLTRYRINSSNQLIPGTGSPASSGVVMVGDAVSGTGIPAGTTVSAVTLLGTPTITLSNNVSSDNTNRTYTITSNKLYVTAMTSGTLFAGDTLSSGATGTVSFGGATLASNKSASTAAGTGSNVPSYYILSGANQGPIASPSITSTSTILTVASMTSGTLYANDVISGSGVASGTAITGNASTPYLPYTGTTGTGLSTDTFPATYKLNVGGVAQPQHVAPTAMQTSSKTITLTGATTVPTVGTALGVTNASFTGCIGSTTSCSGSTANCSGSGTTLRVCAAPGGVPLRVGDVLYGSNVTANTKITTFGTGSGGIGTYTITPSQTAASSTIFEDFFLPDSVTGSINGPILTVTTAASGANLSVGDALFGAGLLPLTRITARGNLTTGGMGTYTITPSQNVASGTIMARAAVTGTPTANSFTVSRNPSSILVGAQLCGGVCPILLSDGVQPVGTVDLTNIVDYDDWSGGFSCVKGIDPNNIKTVVNVMSKQANWSEVVQ